MNWDLFFVWPIHKECGLEERSARRAALEASLCEVLFQIIKFVNDKKDHVPPIPNLEGVISFPYEITIPRWVALFVSTLSIGSYTSLGKNHGFMKDFFSLPLFVSFDLFRYLLSYFLNSYIIFFLLYVLWVPLIWMNYVHRSIVSNTVCEDESWVNLNIFHDRACSFYVLDFQTC